MHKSSITDTHDSSVQNCFIANIFKEKDRKDGETMMAAKNIEIFSTTKESTENTSKLRTGFIKEGVDEELMAHQVISSKLAEN